MANTIHGVTVSRDYIHFETTNQYLLLSARVLDDDGTDAGRVSVVSEDSNIAKLYGKSWSNNDPTRDFFSIKAVSYGRTRFKISSKTDPTKYTYITVDVGPVSTVRDVVLSKSSVYLVAGGRSEQVRASVDASGGSKGISITYSNNNVANVTLSQTSDPAVTLLNVEALNVGETVVTVRSAADTTRYAKLNVKVVAAEEDIPPGGGDEGGNSGDWTPRDAYDQSPLRTTATFFEELGEDEAINDITSVGNTLIISTPKNMYYYLWKEGAYHFLGNKIPVPAIYFRMGNLDAVRSNAQVDWESPGQDGWPEEYQYSFFETNYNTPAPFIPHTTVGETHEYGSPAHRYEFSQQDDEGFWNEYLNHVWGFLDSHLYDVAREGKIIFPIFVRYAVRLYDGSSYAQSIPVLIGADIQKCVDLRTSFSEWYTNNDADIPKTVEAWTVWSFASGYSIFMERANGDIFNGWEDIVTGVDVFVSPQIMPNTRNAAKFRSTFLSEYVDQDRKDADGNKMMKRFFLFDNFTLDPYYTEKNQEKLLLLHQTTYLAKSFSINEYANLSEVTELNDIELSSDHILAQEALKETPQSMHYTRGDNLFNYNKRLLMTNVEQVLHNGYQFLHSAEWKNDGSPAPSYRFVYHLHGENGESIVISRDENGQGLITPKQRAVVSVSQTLYTESPVAWFAYPDSRCYRIDVYQNFGATVMFSSYATKTFDQADVAYVFLGFGVPFQGESYTDMLPTDENPVYRMPNSLVVSKPNNPFVFPAEDVVTFTAGEILNIAVASVPLSEGQAGQFPLYVFTDEGVFAMTVDAEGRLRTSHNVSRDILLSKDALVGIEQGVFFAAARGLLLLQGSRVTKVSSEMDGLPTMMDGPLLGNIETLLGFQVDGQQALRSFLADCILAYDYANTRILVANPRYNAMYVYKFDTQSWHRLQTDFGKPVRVLNAFPEAQVAMKSGHYQSLLDFSVLAENEEAEPLRGLVYTRDLDLEGADIYKAVSKLGFEIECDIQQGSNDGLNYTTIHSLRGPSWKWYRIALVTNLDKDERISYVELDFAPRFTDKIR